MIRIHPLPAGEAESLLHRVTVEGAPAPCHAARVSAIPFNVVWPGHQRPKDQTEPASFVSFETDGPARLAVTLERDFREAVVRPLRHGIRPAVEGRTATFTIPGPGWYTFEADGYSRALHVFADALRPENDGEGATLAFGPGVHDAGLIRLSSGDRMYVHPEAVVFCEVRAEDAHDVRIWGGGIIDNSRFERPDGRCVDFPNGCLKFFRCRNVRVEDVTLRDSCTWSATIFNSEAVSFDRIKTIGMWRYNSDGIDFVNCRHCRITNCFLRNFDDCAVIKGIPGWDHENVCDIRVEGCVVWCDWGRNLEIGAETCADSYEDILFRDCDLIHGVHIYMDIQNGDRAKVRGVRFEDIRCEYSRHTLQDLYQKTDDMEYVPRITFKKPLLFLAENYCGVWSDRGELGDIEGVAVRDIQILADEGMPMPPSELRGVSQRKNVPAEQLQGGPRIRNVVFENVTFNGRPVASVDALNIKCDEFAETPTVR